MVDLAGRRILVAEDMAVQAMEIKQALNDLGCIVVGPAATMSAALALLSEERIDAAITGYYLGDDNSSDLLAELKARGIPFVVMSADSSVPVDAPHLLIKPVPNEQWIEALDEALREPPEPREAS
jgi:DNA-binding NtrC family response regulator